MNRIHRSKDEQFLTYEDSRLGDMLTMNIDPEKLWSMVEGDVTDGFESPTEIFGDGYQIEGEPELYPEGEAIIIPYTQTRLYENGCAVGDSGHILHMAPRPPRLRYGVPVLDSLGREVQGDYYIQVLFDDGVQRRMRVGALMLWLHAGKDKPTVHHTVWFLDGDFSNLKVSNLRWVMKENLRRLSRS